MGRETGVPRHVSHRVVGKDDISIIEL